MAWFEDLTPCNYFGEQFADCLVCIGWLERGRPFPTGTADRAVYAKLIELLNHPWEPWVFMGHHQCDLCLYDGTLGTRNLFVPAGNVVFVCPELVVHYMNAHEYRPPEEFCSAVLTCPPMRSMQYLKALLAGARSLVKSAEA